MNQPLPTFSVVIPTFDRPNQLATCLESLAVLDYPRERYEVIVVDDGGPGLLDRVVEPFHDRLDLTLVRQPHSGPAIARNTGAGCAKGRYLAFTDDDCIPALDWLGSLAGRLDQAEGPVLVGGHTRNCLPENPYSAASQLLIDYLYAYFQGRQGRFFTSNNLALSAEAFHAVGGFERRIPLAAAEDREFCGRWSQRGLPLVHAPEAVVLHAHVLDFHRFCKQHFNYGRGAFYYRRLMAREGGARVELEPVRFYSNLVGYPLERSRDWRAVWLAVLLGIAQVANASGFVFERTAPLDADFLRRGVEDR